MTALPSGSDGQGHHGELRQDEGREADGHDMKEILLKQQQSSKHDDSALI